LSAYYAAQLITKEWMQPINESHDVFSVNTKQKKPTSSLAVTVYAVRRPDKQWALLAINKHPKRAASSTCSSTFPAHNSQFVLLVRLRSFNFRNNNTPGTTTDQTDTQSEVSRQRDLREKHHHSTSCRRTHSQFCAENFRIN